MAERELDILRRDGLVVLKRVIPPDEVGAIRESVAATVRKHTPVPLPQGYVTGFLRLNQAIAPYLTHPRIMELVNELFGDNARISILTGIINGPGIKRGQVHADWPYNQNQFSRVSAPYPDVVMNLVTMWMLSSYTRENGGTIVLLGSHKRNNAPRTGTDLDPDAIYEGESQLQGEPGDVGVFDARTWHAIAPNRTQEERVGVLVRYAPWWVNLNPLRPGSRDRKQIVDDQGGADVDPKVEPIPASVYARLPADVQPLVYHMAADD